MLKNILKQSITPALFCLVTLASCSNPNNNAISTVFVHKYGATLAENDWDSRGGNGQIVTTCKDGSRITENYVDSYLEGKTTYTFPHSSVIAKEEIYSRGNLMAESENFTTGVPKSKTEYISDSEYHVTTWFENGNPRTIETFIDDFLESGEYYTTSHELESQVIAGVGTKIERNTYGEFVAKIEYKDGEQRLKTTYHPNGDPRCITPYIAGKIHGVRKFFHINGIPECFEEWSNGVHQGQTTTYRDGQLHTEVPYIANMKNGVETVFNEKGDIVVEVTWKNDLMHGVKKQYINDSIRMEWFYKGKKVSHSDFEKLAIL